MTISAIFGFMYSLSKAVPVIDKWLTEFYEFFVMKKVAEIENHHTTKSSKIAVVLFKIKKAKTHEEKRVLMSLLTDIERL